MKITVNTSKKKKPGGFVAVPDTDLFPSDRTNSVYCTTVEPVVVTGPVLTPNGVSPRVRLLALLVLATATALSCLWWAAVARERTELIGYTERRANHVYGSQEGAVNGKCEVVPVDER